MTTVIAGNEVTPSTTKDTDNERHFYQVFLGFRKPGYGTSVFSSCNIYEHLGKIFERPPADIFQSIRNLHLGEGNGFMQEYLSLEDASLAVTQASLFANTVQCTCFLIQEAYFHIENRK